MYFADLMSVDFKLSMLLTSSSSNFKCQETRLAPAGTSGGAVGNLRSDDSFFSNSFTLELQAID
jgi:hypothetical protein